MALPLDRPPPYLVHAPPWGTFLPPIPRQSSPAPAPDSGFDYNIQSENNAHFRPASSLAVGHGFGSQVSLSSSTADSGVSPSVKGASPTNGGDVTTHETASRSRTANSRHNNRGNNHQNQFGNNTPVHYSTNGHSVAPHDHVRFGGGRPGRGRPGSAHSTGSVGSQAPLLSRVKAYSWLRRNMKQALLILVAALFLILVTALLIVILQRRDTHRHIHIGHGEKIHASNSFLEVRNDIVLCHIGRI